MAIGGYSSSNSMSAQKYGAFGAVLMPIMVAEGVTMSAPHISPIHHLIKP